jgi:hypothetical protein
VGDRIQVNGLRKATAKLTKFGVEASDLKDVMFKAGNLVATEARTLAPRKSGKLANSIRASKAKNKATVRAGGARVPYAGVQNYGRYHNITAKHFMERALTAKRPAVLWTVKIGLQTLINRAGLG